MMMRLGKWATVVAGAVMVLNISSIAQEQAVEPAAQQPVEPVVNPPVDAPVDSAVEAPAPSAEEPAALLTEEPPVEPPAEPPAPPVAKFVGINDAVPSRFFDAEATAEHADDHPNRLIIAFHSGIDWTTYKATEFRASSASFSYAAAMDTISFRVEAPAGFSIATITYSQAGAGSIIRTGKAAGSAHWVVGAFAAPLGLFGTNPTLNGEANLTGLGLTSVPVSITNGLFAFATPTSGSASVEVTGAEVTVCLEPLIGSGQPLCS
jgi:hypothetical protein